MNFRDPDADVSFGGTLKNLKAKVLQTVTCMIRRKGLFWRFQTHF